MEEPIKTTTELSAESVDRHSDFYVVGIGASAGGLEALEKTFRAMPEDTGMAFVIVQHLSPDFKSLMDELLARHTKMPIHRVEDGMLVQPNSLYLIPPKQDMVIRDGRLRLTEKDSSQPLSLPIDHFFRSLAKDCRSRGIAIVLSGTGSDGSRGLRDVHEAGGLVIVQSVESSRFDGMPLSALDTRLVDLVVPPAKIADALCRYAQHPIRSQLAQPPINESSLEHVFRLLQERHGIDFNHYKPATIIRRIERRVQLQHHNDITDYVQTIENDPEEVDQLYRDLLIGVTRFFRDDEAFEALQRDILPALILAEPAGSPFRAWVAACGTGEEAYSIAIAINECMRRLKHPRSVKIFATDVHVASIETAHVGKYPAAQLDDMDEERRARYFNDLDTHFQVRPELREMIVFAPHNLNKDAPFTRLHLVTCRNLLIYFRPSAQKRAISLFHFSLLVGGVMFLGASESPGDLIEEFEQVNDRWKMYRKLRDVRLATDFQIGSPLESVRQLSGGLRAINHETVTESDRELLANIDAMLNQFMPPGMMVSDRGEVIRLFNGAGRYLAPGDGRPSNHISDMSEGDLRLALTSGLQSATRTKQPVAYPGVIVNTLDGPRKVRLEIKPIRAASVTTPYLITFGEAVKTGEVPATIVLDSAAKTHMQELELELRHTRENLQATIEELETSNEELQATNEEMVASNEELQSTNEELHSVNEELYSVNAEYQTKITELTELTNDMDNLLASTEVHTLFLDDNLCIRKFTPKMVDVFDLVPHDVGRRIHSFTHSIKCPGLMDALLRVLDDGTLYEEPVQDAGGHHFLMRILPYRIGRDISGAVLTLIDIDSLVASQAEVDRERDRFERAIAANRDGTWDWMDINSDEMWWSPNCYSVLGYEPDAFLPRHSKWLELIHPEDRERVNQTSVPGNNSCYVELHRDFEYRMLHASGEYRWYRHRAMVDHDEFGKPCRMTGSVGDIHDRKMAEMMNVEAIRRRDNFLSMLSHELRNPLGAVLNAVELSRQKEHPESEDQATPEMQIINRQSRHMARLLDDLLDVARFGQDRIDFRKEVVDLNSLAQETVEAVSHLVRAKSQDLQISTCGMPLYVYVDPVRIKQAQINLLTNASKYSGNGQPIAYQLSRDGDEAVIEVVDSGEGVAAEMLEDIFDLFVQCQTTLARSSGGMGVGLSLARSIVHAHSGTIRAESAGAGAGCRFTIRLPITTEVPTPDVAKTEQQSSMRRVLLVEDNDDARMMLRKTLELKGFEVAEAVDGLAVFDVIATFTPDVAVIDIGLPGMDGYEVASKLRTLPSHRKVKLIALTGYGREEDRAQAIEAGFDSHLVKPLDFDRLLAELARD
jgi:two-component system CheB/CheR fusion protein